jgi:hypothetical protein
VCAVVSVCRVCVRACVCAEVCVVCVQWCGGERVHRLSQLADTMFQLAARVEGSWASLKGISRSIRSRSLPVAYPEFHALVSHGARHNEGMQGMQGCVPEDVAVGVAAVVAEAREHDRALAQEEHHVVFVEPGYRQTTTTTIIISIIMAMMVCDVLCVVCVVCVCCTYPSSLETMTYSHRYQIDFSLCCARHDTHDTHDTTHG